MPTQLSDVLTFARAQAQTDTNGLTNSNGIIFANEAQSDLHRKLIARGVDASQLQEAYRDGAVNTGTYLYPTDMFFLKTIELNYTDTSPNNYKRASQVDVANLQGNVSFGWLRQNGNRNDPQFDDRGDWFEIFPTPSSSDNVSQMIRLFYYLKPTDYSSVSDTVNYPTTLDYRILGWRIAASYLYSLGQTNKADAFNLKYEQKMNELITTLSRGSQQPTQAKRLAIDGYEF
jgi:hypothetical protein